MTPQRRQEILTNMAINGGKEFILKRVEIEELLTAAGELQKVKAERDTEIKAVLDLIPGAVRVCESGGPENLYASLAVSCAKLTAENASLRRDREALQQIVVWCAKLHHEGRIHLPAEIYGKCLRYYPIDAAGKDGVKE